MKETIVTCDHCGKKLDEMKDYIDLELYDFYKIIDTDLCVACYEELTNVVKQFCKKDLAIK